MNGATALDCEKTINRPNSTNTTTIGTSQYFFSCLRNCQNSDSTRPLLITTSRTPGALHTLRPRPPLGSTGAPRPRRRSSRGGLCAMNQLQDRGRDVPGHTRVSGRAEMEAVQAQLWIVQFRVTGRIDDAHATFGIQACGQFRGDPRISGTIAD